MTAASGASRHADALVLFGGTGDLAFKKIFPALQSLAKLGALNLPVLAVTRGLRDKQALLARMRESINKHGDGVDEDVFRDLSNRLQVVPDESGEASTYRLLKETLAGSVRPLFYLAIPPSAYPSVVNALALADCAHGGRLLIEKPFGHDLSSSRALDEAIHRVFDEARVFRLDHYAGKLSVQNVVLFRFANSFGASAEC